jgi:hypothetical protein
MLSPTFAQICKLSDLKIPYPNLGSRCDNCIQKFIDIATELLPDAGTKSQTLTGHFHKPADE